MDKGRSKTASVCSSAYVSRRVLKDNHFPDDLAFQGLCSEIEKAIQTGVDPLLAKEGSSGTYFMRDSKGNIVGVFKPKDEEPFAPLNPKWPKFFQRVCCPCCFGRSCLLTNNGYLAEVAASLIDEKLGFNLVPKTRLVWFSSATFNYHEKQRKFLPAKPGSLQTFVNDYQHAGIWLKRWEQEPLDEENNRQLLVLMQQMVILDYLIRNTDRSSANWLIHLKEGGHPSVAIIDNGLAFPVKHPVQESWLRPFPFYWADLPLAKEPFVPELRQLLQEQLDEPKFLIQLTRELKKLFQADPGFNQILFEGQMRVMRGQAWNIRHLMHGGGSPFDLAQLPPVLVTMKKKLSGRSSEQGGQSCSDRWKGIFKLKHVQQKSCCVLM